MEDHRLPAGTFKATCPKLMDESSLVAEAAPVTADARLLAWKSPLQRHNAEV